MTMTNTASAAPAAKKPKINQFRRLLWHVNRTDLGWVTKATLTSLQLGARAKRIEMLNSLPAAPEWSAASRQLSEQGYVDVSSIVDRGLAEAVLNVSQDKVSRLDELVAKQQLGHKSFWVSLLDEDLVDGAFATDHPFVRYALQPAVLRIMGDFMHELPQLSDVLLTLSRPTENKPLTYSQLWHLDHDDKRVCKLFIYLTDVRDTADGPLTFIPAPSSKPFRNTIKSHMSRRQGFRQGRSIRRQGNHRAKAVVVYRQHRPVPAYGQPHPVRPDPPALHGHLYPAAADVSGAARPFPRRRAVERP